MMFAGLTSAYIVKRDQPNWITFEMPQIFWYSTGIMLASSLAIQVAVRSFKDREMGRYRALVVATLLMGVVPVIVVLKSPYNQRLGDLAAGTILVRTKERHTIQDTIFREIHQPDYTPQFSQILRLSDRDLSKIKSVLDNVHRTSDTSMAERISLRIKEVLHIETDMEAVQFLETLLNDYNYLVTRK